MGVTKDSFAQRLLDWFDQHGRKDLPWQKPRTAYRVWVSEIMLQQTQVSTVIPYFERWMQRFPDLHSLAATPLDEVLEFWAGLGYYARARNLHRAAETCVNKYAGELPVTAEELCELPGIGLSTANAIVSQSTDLPAAVLDGNVRRVLARHTGLEEWTGSGKGQEKLWAAATQRLPTKRGADYTQAIMDLGALLCTRSNPDCPACPVAGDCVAYTQGVQDSLPVARPATKVTKKQYFWLAVIDEESRILLEKRPPSGIWGGLWCLPEAECLEQLELDCGLDLSRAEILPARAHRLSHIAMSIHPVLLSSAVIGQVESKVKSAAEQQWFSLAADQLPALPKPVVDLLVQLRERGNTTGNPGGD